MKNCLLIFMFLGGTITICRAQKIIDTAKQINIVHLPEYYKEKGVIFSKDYVVGIDMKGMKYRYTPTIDDITKVEEIFDNKYNEVQKTSVDTKDFFCRWVRQYVGLIDSNGKKNVIVQLINNAKPRQINRLLGKDWESDFVIMLADKFYKVSTRFRVNIDTGDMTTKL